MNLSDHHKRASIGLAALLLLLSLLTFSQTRDGAMQGYELHARFNDVTGVQKGTTVRLAGVSVGQVTKMALAQDGKVQLTVQMEEEVLIPKDSAIAVQKDGLFGAAVLVVEVGGDEAMLAPQEFFSYSEDALTLDDLLDAVIQQGTSRKKQEEAQNG